MRESRRDAVALRQTRLTKARLSKSRRERKWQICWRTSRGALERGVEGDESIFIWLAIGELLRRMLCEVQESPVLNEIGEKGTGKK